MIGEARHAAWPPPLAAADAMALQAPAGAAAPAVNGLHPQQHQQQQQPHMPLQPMPAQPAQAAAMQQAQPPAAPQAPAAQQAQRSNQNRGVPAAQPPPPLDAAARMLQQPQVHAGPQRASVRQQQPSSAALAAPHTSGTGAVPLAAPRDLLQAQVALQPARAPRTGIVHIADSDSDEDAPPLRTTKAQRTGPQAGLHRQYATGQAHVARETGATDAHTVAPTGRTGGRADDDMDWAPDDACGHDGFESDGGLDAGYLSDQADAGGVPAQVSFVAERALRGCRHFLACCNAL